MSMSAGVLKGPSYAVSDLDRSIAFYSNVLGFKVVEENRAQGVARVALDDDAAAMTVELLQQPSASSASIATGDAFAGVGVRVPSAAQIFQSAAAQGGRVVLEVGDFAYAASLVPDEDEMRNTPVRCARTWPVLPHNTTSHPGAPSHRACRYGRLADPDGYLIEVREDAKLAPAAKRLFKMVLNVLDIEESVAFYRDIAGMAVLRRRSNVYSVPKVQHPHVAHTTSHHLPPFPSPPCPCGQDASMCAYLGYADEAAGPYLELNYNYATDKLAMGNGFRQAAVQVTDTQLPGNASLPL